MLADALDIVDSGTNRTQVQRNLTLTRYGRNGWLAGYSRHGLWIALAVIIRVKR